MAQSWDGVHILRSKKMVQKRYTVSTKINERENLELNKLAERENISITAIMKLFVDALLNGDIELEKGELKICTPAHEDCVSAISNEDFEENLRYKELRFDRLLSTFEKKNYPDMAIRSAVESIIGQLLDGGNYNARRNYDSDCGC